VRGPPTKPQAHFYTPEAAAWRMTCGEPSRWATVGGSGIFGCLTVVQFHDVDPPERDPRLARIFPSASITTAPHLQGR
jgi:hypothetical protein